MATAKGARLNSLKQKALQVLRRRKMYDQQLGHVMNQQFNVDQVAFTTESIQDNINTMNALKSANEVQKQQMKALDMDQMEDIFDDMADMMADMEEVQDVMGRAYNCDFDENELIGELDELDQELAEDQLNEGLGIPSYVPNANKANASASAAGAEPAQADALNDMMQI